MLFKVGKKKKKIGENKKVGSSAQTMVLNTNKKKSIIISGSALSSTQLAAPEQAQSFCR